MTESSPNPTCQLAVWVDVPGQDAKPYLKEKVPVPDLGLHDVLVKLDYTGLW